MVSDPLSGIAGGLAGTAVMTIILFIADALTGFQIQAFRAIAGFVGTPNDILLGFFVFVGAGAIAWPLLFVALDEFLPGDSDAVSGMVFASVLWISFALAFSPGVGGFNLFLYLALTLLAHLAYGFTLGTVYERLADRVTHGV